MHCDCANQALKTKQVGSRDSSWMEGHKVIIDIGGEMTIKVNADLFTVAGDNKFSAMLSHRWREHGSSFDCNIFVDYSPMVFMPLIDSELQRVAEDIFCIILSLFCFLSLWSCAGCCCCVNLFCEPLCLSRHWWVSVLLQQLRLFNQYICWWFNMLIRWKRYSICLQMDFRPRFKSSWVFQNLYNWSNCSSFPNPPIFLNNQCATNRGMATFGQRFGTRHDYTFASASCVSHLVDSHDDCQQFPPASLSESQLISQRFAPRTTWIRPWSKQNARKLEKTSMLRDTLFILFWHYSIDFISYSFIYFIFIPILK